MSHNRIANLISAQPQLENALQFFQIVQDELRIDGRSPDELVALSGGEPLYAYSRQAIQLKIARVRDVLPQGVKLHYAVKANPYVPLVQSIAAHVDGFDVASRKELQIALETGITPNAIGFAGPGKNDLDLRAAIAAGCVIHAESVNELTRIQNLSGNKNVGVALRVNPNFELKQAGMKMTGGPKAFGMDVDTVQRLLDDFDWKNIDLVGFHIYCGSQNLNVNALLDAQRQTLSLVQPWLVHCKNRPYVNIGGGFGVPYFAHDKPLDEEQLAQGMRTVFEEFSEVIHSADIVIELGRYLVAETGVYLSKVIDVKKSQGKTFVVCSGGLHHHLANSGNFGQVVRRNYPVVLANKINVSQLVEQTLVGPLCTPLDILADNLLLPKAEVGDWVAILMSGAYGASASPQGFLGHDGVREIMV